VASERSSLTSACTSPGVRIVQVACKVTDAGGQAVTTVSSAGEGKATSSELMKNFSIAGQRASQDALIKLRESLLQSADLRK
jgi:hypothetical protein